MRVRSTVVLTTMVASLTLTSSASAATVLGAVDPAAAPNAFCNVANFDYVQRISGSLNSYTVPPGGGVITSWSTKFGPVGATMKLLVLKSVGGNNFQLVGESGFGALTSALGQSSFPTRISVSGGELLGKKHGPTAPDEGCFFEPTAILGAGDANALSIGGQKAFTPSPGFGLNMSATLEPDVDKDTFGDETQDLCPTDATKQGECVAPSAVLGKHPKKKSKPTTATFKFSSDDPAATFQCAIDTKALKPCSSPKKFRKLKARKHRFTLVATDSVGNASAPTIFRWRVVD
jgi:hypothetical protein